MAELLLFNIQDPEKKTALRLTALRLGLQCREIPAEHQGRTVDELLAGVPNEDAAVPEGSFDDEMMLMYSLGQAEFHELLDTLRREGQSVRLKAIVTDHNRKWTALRLYRELCAEEEAMSRWRQSTTKKKKRK